MDAMLRIQVKVLARDANVALRQVQTQVRQIGMASLAAQRSTAAAERRQNASDAAALHRQVMQQARTRANDELRQARRAADERIRLARSASREEQRIHREMASLPGVRDHLRGGLMNWTRMGKDLQWVGRQINFNFTIPLMIAAGAAGNWALEVERAFTRLKKVYGDGSRSAAEYEGELALIRRGVRALSDVYGVAQDDVMELAASWAAAGAEGAALARSVETSLRLGILGDYDDLTQTFEDLIVIQQAYRMSADELATTIALLNTVENTQAITLPGLVEGIARVGSMADTAGVSVRELAAMLAVLTPATGTAATAGNSLKTILSRLAAPTVQMVDLIRELGINYQEFQSMTGTERLQLLADTFDSLTDSQQAYAASVLAGRRQVNRFLALMADMQDRAGIFHDVMEQIDPSRDAANWARANQEIQILLESDPRKIEILTNMIKNLAIDAVLPLIPAFIGLLTAVREAFQWFGNLDPRVQSLTMGFLALIVVTGILSQFIGSAILLIATFARGLIWVAGIPGLVVKAFIAMGGAVLGVLKGIAAVAAGVGNVLVGIVAGLVRFAGLALAGFGRLVAGLARFAPLLVRALAGPWGIALSGVLLLVATFRDEIVGFMSSIGRSIANAFNSLPQAVGNAFSAVIRVISSAIDVVRDLLSWLNPFARHSPSLVDNVQAGVAIIGAEYAKLTNVGAGFRRAADDLRAFAAATESVRRASRVKEQGEQRQKVAAVAPGAVGALDALFGDLGSLRADLDAVSAAIATQMEVVRPLKAAYDAAAYAVDRFELSMEPLRRTVESLEQQISDANAEIDRLVNVPIAGLGAMEDAIFNNEMAQKRLRLELAKMGGAGYESIRDQIASINGEIERLRSDMKGLRLDGAGSDVLGVFQDQIDALEAQKNGLTEQAQAGLDLERQLEELQRQAEILDLEKALAFDPLTRQIEKAASAVEEMSFDDILAGIKEQRSKVDELTASYDVNKAALDAQQAVLDQMIAKRDALKNAYDVEDVKLQALEDTYTQISGAIRDIEGAINDVIGAHRMLTSELDADAMKKAAGAAAGAAGAADIGGLAAVGEGADFGDSVVGDFSSEFDLESLVAGWEEQAAKLFDVDIWGWVMSGWDRVVAWWNDTVMSRVNTWIDWIVETWGSISSRLPDIDFGAVFDTALNAVTDAWRTVVDFVGGLFEDLGNNRIVQAIGGAFSWIAEHIPGYLSGLWKNITEFGDMLREKFSEWSELWEPIKDLWPTIVTVFKAIVKSAKVALAVLAAIFKTGWEVLRRVVDNVWNVIEGTIGNSIDFIRGILKIGLGLLNLDFGQVMSGLATVADAIWEQIKLIFGNAIGAIGGIVSGLWAAFIDIGGDIMGGLLEGLGNAVGAVIDWFIALPGNIIDHFKRILGIRSPSTVFAEIGGNILRGLVEGLVATAQLVWDWIGEFAGGFIEGIVDRLAPFGEVVGNAIQAGVDAAKWVWGGITAVYNFFKDEVVDPVVEKAGEFKDLLGEKIQSVIDWVKDVWDDLAAVYNFFKDEVVDRVVDKAGEFKDLLGEKIQSVIDWVKDVWDDLTDLYDFFTTEVVDKVVDKAGEFKDLLGSGIQEIVDWAQSKWQGILSIYSWFVDNVFFPLKNKVTDLKDSIVGAFEDAVSGVESAWDLLKGVVKAPVNVVIGFYNNGIRALWNNIISKIPGIRDLPEVELLNKGGRVPGVGDTDTVPAMLTPGEFVITKSAAASWGPDVLHALNEGRGSIDPAIFGYNSGGYVRSAEEAFNWAKAQHGKPYEFPMVGPDSYDCSGFTSALINYILGLNPHSRRHSSGSVGADPALKWGPSPNPVGLTIGARPPYMKNQIGAFVGHTAATLFGEPMEATPPAVRVGFGARGANDPLFSQQWHLPGFGGLSYADAAVVADMMNLSGTSLNAGLTPPIGDLLEKLVNQLPDMIWDLFTSKLPQIILDAIADIIGGVTDAIDDFFTRDVSGRFVPIAENARGSIVARPTLTWVGENYKPEAIIPLTDASRAMRLMDASGLTALALSRANQAPAGFVNARGDGSGGKTTNITFTGDLSFPNISDPDDADRFISNLEALAGV